MSDSERENAAVGIERMWDADEWAVEAKALRQVVRELVRNDGLYGGAPGWQEGSLCGRAFDRAMNEEQADG